MSLSAPDATEQPAVSDDGQSPEAAATQGGDDRFAELESRIQRQADELAAAEAVRDETACRLAIVENRLAAERRMHQAGVADVDAASVLLGERIDLHEPLEAEQIDAAVDALLLDKPFLRRDAGSLPPASASARQDEPAGAARLADAAERAARTGDRRDVAEYLRLRRDLSPE